MISIKTYLEMLLRFIASFWILLFSNFHVGLEIGLRAWWKFEVSNPDKFGGDFTKVLHCLRYIDIHIFCRRLKVHVSSNTISDLSNFFKILRYLILLTSSFLLFDLFFISFLFEHQTKNNRSVIRS